MKPSTDTYHYIIIGSGISGLLCGAYLTRQGKRVLILEKNHQIGGSLQVFSRDKKIFDTGVHYIGSLGEGQVLHRLFRYFGVLDDLRFTPLDRDGFDKIFIEKEGLTVSMPTGWEALIDSLSTLFPDDKDGLNALYEYVKKVLAYFGPYHLQPLSDTPIPVSVFSEGAYEVISGFIKSKTLQSILAGNGLLYASDREITPFYIWVLIFNSYVEGSYRMYRGGSQIAKALSKVIHDQGGEIQKYAEVSELLLHEGLVSGVRTRDGRYYECDRVISSIHPQNLIPMLGKGAWRKTYTERVQDAPNMTSFVSVFFTMKPHSWPYFHHNEYHLSDSDAAWKVFGDVLSERWPDNMMISTGWEEEDQEWCNTVNVLCYADYALFEKWSESHNTIAQPSRRPEEYEILKQKIIQRVSEKMEKKWAGFMDAVQSVYCATPLTYRDYLATPRGSGYGYVKNYHDPMYSFFGPKTKVQNLYLTGQNTDIHGVYGASISALLTLSHLEDGKHIFEKMNGTNGH